MTDQDDQPLTLDEMLAEIRGRLRTLESGLPKQIESIGIFRTKLQFKVLSYREALIWRVAELARASLQAVEVQQFAAAIVLTRAVVERNAGLWYLNDKVATALKEKKLRDLEQYNKLSEYAHPNSAGTTGLYSKPTATISW